MQRRTRGAIVGGAVLIIVGILTFVGQLIPDAMGELFGTFLLLGLGIIFLIAGIITRESGWFIPGGILTGLGAGVGFITSSFAERFTVDEGGLFLMIFAAGWFLIPIMSIIFSDERHLWALIPGVIIGLVGFAVIYGGVFMDVLEWIGYLWPLALIAAGVYILWRIRHPKEKEIEPVEKHA